MQEIREDFGDRQVTDRLFGFESQKLREAFAARRDAAQERLEAGKTKSLEVKEVRRISRNDPCPCGSGVKFKKCCGKRLRTDDKRIAN